MAQVKERSYSVKDVSGRLGGSTKSMYDWLKQFHKSEPMQSDLSVQAQENRQLRAELKRVTEERDIQKATAYFAKDTL